ncbi:MAG: lipopolysaccharide heptosyltransferase I [Betaproteobacteria bacterium]|nr:lipopolysaccharide heptosyltransferase I [Betaproteobacteria bacterium]
MAKSILLVKTSSLGDVIHALPAVSDMRAVMPDLHVDWLVEESLVAIPRLHAGVAAVIPVALRRWRRSFWRKNTRDEISAFAGNLRTRTYDAVIDAQGLFKSAVIALMARGPRHGLDFHSAREPLGLFYQRCYRIGWDIHAVERNRQLVAKVLGYAIDRPCDFGISAAPHEFAWLGHGPYAVLLHATSGDYKLWPEAHWVALADKFAADGIRCVLTWGNAREQARCVRLAERMKNAVIAPALDFAALAGLFAGAVTVVGVDTGLTHLAAALGRPTVGIYLGTDPAATGIHGCARARNIGGIGAVPAVEEALQAISVVTG